MKPITMSQSFTSNSLIAIAHDCMGLDHLWNNHPELHRIMAHRKIPVGIKDFRAIRELDFYYVEMISPPP